jgi:hypothetical protein
MEPFPSSRPARRGSALAMVLPMTLVLSMLGLTMISSSLSSTRLSRHRHNSAAAFELAEAGFNHSVRTMRSNKNYSGQENTSLGSGTFRVTVSTPTADWNKKWVVATGRVKSLGESYVEKSVRGLADFQSPVWDYAIVTKQALNLAGNVTINSSPNLGVGNIHSNTSVTVGSNPIVNGRATSAGALSATGLVTGGTQSNAPAVPFPTVDTAGLLAEAEARGTMVGDRSYSSGTTILSGKLVGNLATSSTARPQIDGILWVTGNVDLAGQAWVGDGTLICEGRMTISGGSGFTGAETNSLALVCLSSSLSTSSPAVSISGNSVIRGPIYAPNGMTTISGGPTIFGTLATNAVSLSGNPTFTRNTDLISPWSLASGPRVRWWEEL